MRNDLLGILKSYMGTGNRSVFFSTHITSDLEKIADYIVYIHQGRIVYSGVKEGLYERFKLTNLEEIMLHVRKNGVPRGMASYDR